MNDFLRGFKDFALRGNVIDLAVGVVIGAAFFLSKRHHHATNRFALGRHRFLRFLHQP